MKELVRKIITFDPIKAEDIDLPRNYGFDKRYFIFGITLCKDTIFRYEDNEVTLTFYPGHIFSETKFVDVMFLYYMTDGQDTILYHESGSRYIPVEMFMEYVSMDSKSKHNFRWGNGTSVR